MKPKFLPKHLEVNLAAFNTCHEVLKRAGVPVEHYRNTYIATPGYTMLAWAYARQSDEFHLLVVKEG